MCGIIGFNFEDKKLAKEMCNTLEHRGPDQHAIYTDKGISLGHRRLSIIDLSVKGRQPMFNEDKTICIIFNGEVYNFKEIRKQLEEKGHKFNSNTDTEAVLHAYEEYGENCLSLFNGMFAFAIYNLKNKKLFIARDRIGIKPLYYYYNEEQNIFIFASEIKAILKYPEYKRAINPDSLHSYLALQYSIGTDTMFKDIKKLDNASYIIFDNSKKTISITRYWDLDMNSPINIDENTLIAEVKQRLKKAVELRLMSDVPLGALLSGGIDSSSVVALMSQLTDQPVKTFSTGFNESDDELRYARLVSETFSTDHKEFLFSGKDVINALPKIVYHYDIPLADQGALPTFLMCKDVKKKVTVALVGEGSDEVFAGYRWHTLMSPYLRLTPFSLRKRMYYYLNTFSSKKDLKNRLYLNTLTKNKSMYKRFDKRLSDYSNTNNTLSMIQKFEINNLLPNSLLMKVDKTTMAHSIEARVPFLDHTFVEFMAKIHPSYKLRGLTGKYILKKAMHSTLPSKIINRKKHGFMVPLGKWLKGEMHEFAVQNLLDKDAIVQKYYKTDKIHSILYNKKENRIKKITNDALLWRLLLFELWHKVYFREGDR